MPTTGATTTGATMTESRENVRRKQFRDLQPTSTGEPTRLDRLCLIRGCLNPRTGTNLCRACNTRTNAI